MSPTPAKPFVTRPIRYELAYGGEDADRRELRNPVGVGFATDPEHLVDKPAPSIVYAEGDPAERGPAGFGPIDRPWSPRRERAGTYDEAWQRGRWPLLPEDYDELFASCAPDDQRVAPHLRGGELIQLENLTPEGLLRFTLPRIYFTYTTRLGSRRAQHRGRMTSVVIQPEQRRVAVIWQSTLRVDAIDEAILDSTTVSEKPYLARPSELRRTVPQPQSRARRVSAS